MYSLKMTDRHVYLYNHQTKELSKEPIPSKTIKNLKIYNVPKAIKILAKLTDKIGYSLFKTKINILVSNKLTPAEYFLYDYVARHVPNIKYRFIKEESLLENKKEIIIWDEYLTINGVLTNVKQTSNYNKRLSKECILIGISDKYNEIQEKLSKPFKTTFLEYETGEVTLFERVR